MGPRPFLKGNFPLPWILLYIVHVGDFIHTDESIHQQLYTEGKKVLHCPVCVAILETFYSTHGKKSFILRQKNLSKHCLLRFLCLNTKITIPHEPQRSSKTSSKEKNK